MLSTSAMSILHSQYIVNTINCTFYIYIAFRNIDIIYNKLHKITYLEEVLWNIDLLLTHYVPRFLLITVLFVRI